MIPLYFAFKKAFLLAGFAVGFMIGASGALIRNALFPPAPKIHYCYPDSTEDICRRVPEPPPTPENERVAVRDHD